MSSLFGKLGVETYANGRKGKEALKRCRSQEKVGKEFETRRLFKGTDLKKWRLRIYVRVITVNENFQSELNGNAVVFADFAGLWAIRKCSLFAPNTSNHFHNLII